MLQQVSAKSACRALETVYDAVACGGVRIVLAGRGVLVDLLCSGARTLLLTRLAVAGAAAICRPAPLQAAAGFLIALAWRWRPIFSALLLCPWLHLSLV
jgi:hypothetical protein